MTRGLPDLLEPNWDEVCSGCDFGGAVAEYFLRGAEWATAAGWWLLADLCLFAARQHREVR